MSMMDLQSALGGPPGGGPPAISVPGAGGPEAGLPPGGGLPPEGLPPEGLPPEPPLGPEGGGDSLDFLDAAEDALNQFIQVDPDEVDRAEAAKALQIILKLKAVNQQDAEKGGMKALRKALGGAGVPLA